MLPSHQDKRTQTQNDMDAPNPPERNATSALPYDDPPGAMFVFAGVANLE